MSTRRGRRERRAAGRYGAHLPVELHCGLWIGYGSITDVSLSGARIELVSYRPLPGKRVRILLCLDQAQSPVELPAEVVRFTETEGFAVRFLDLDVGMLIILRAVLARVEELSAKQDRS